jgi:hypothetical protein
MHHGSSNSSSSSSSSSRRGRHVPVTRALLTAATASSWLFLACQVPASLPNDGSPFLIATPAERGSSSRASRRGLTVTPALMSRAECAALIRQAQPLLQASQTTGRLNSPPPSPHRATCPTYLIGIWLRRARSIALVQQCMAALGQLHRAGWGHSSASAGVVLVMLTWPLAPLRSDTWTSGPPSWLAVAGIPWVPSCTRYLPWTMPRYKFLYSGQSDGAHSQRRGWACTGEPLRTRSILRIPRGRRPRSHW